MIQRAEESDHWSFSKVSFDPRRVYRVAPPLGGAHFDKLLLWRPLNRQDGTALIANVVDAVQMRLRALSSEYGRDCFRGLFSGDHDYLPECCFEFFGAQGQHRLLEVFNDGRWEFRSESKPLSFEDVSQYGNTRIKERLTPSIVAEYLRSVGWDVSDEAFWGSAVDAVMACRVSWGPPLRVEDLL